MKEEEGETGLTMGTTWLGSHDRCAARHIMGRKSAARQQVHIKMRASPTTLTLPPGFSARLQTRQVFDIV